MTALHAGLDNLVCLISLNEQILPWHILHAPEHLDFPAFDTRITPDCRQLAGVLKNVGRQKAAQQCSIGVPKAHFRRDEVSPNNPKTLRCRGIFTHLAIS